MQRYDLPRGQRWLTSFMKSLEPSWSNLDGICSGFAKTALSSILLKATDKLDDRLNRIHTTTAEVVKKEVDLTRDARKTNHDLPVTMAEEIMVFFEGIQINQNVMMLTYLRNLFDFPKELFGEINIGLNLIMPKELEDQGGITSAFLSSGVYSEKDLIDYFTYLGDKVLAANKHDLPIAFLLSNGNHAIVIGFNIIDDNDEEWLLIDANRLPTKHIDDPGEMAEQVFKSFFQDESGNEQVIFNTFLVASKKNASVVNDIINFLNDDADWEALHQFSEKKTRKLNYKKISWLHLAVRTPNVDLVKKIIKYIDPNQMSEDKMFPLGQAVFYNNYEAVKVLLQHPDINPNCTQGNFSPLYCAVLRKATNMVQLLLAHPKIDPNLSAILHTIIVLDSIEIMELFLAHPLFDANKTDTQGRTPLQFALALNKAEMIKTLLKYHPDVVCLLYEFAIIDNIETVKTLFKCLMDQYQTDFGIQSENYIEIAEKLLVYLKNPNKVDSAGYTLLQRVILNNNAELCKVLLKHRLIDPNQVANGRTPLQIAIEYNRLDILEILLAQPLINPAYVRSDGYTLLHLAVSFNNVKAVEQLLKHPLVNAALLDQQGRTAFDLAVEYGFDDIVKLFRQKIPHSLLNARNYSFRSNHSFFIHDQDHKELFPVDVNNEDTANELFPHLDKKPRTL